MSVLIVKMAERPFLARGVSHRRWRLFTAKINVFHTQFDTQFFSVSYVEHGDMLY